MEKNYWLKLIRSWTAKGRTGLTLPFIIGAKKIIQSDYKVQPNDIGDLIAEIATNQAVTIFMNRCPDLQDLILGIYNPEIKMSGHFPIYNSKPQNRFFVTTAVTLPSKESLELIIEDLIAKYSDDIVNERFSRSLTSRSYYNEQEIEFILKTLNEQ